MSYKTPDKISRLSCPALDEILGQGFPVLDDGFVRVVDYMGDESSIVQAARVSYGKGTKKLHEDRGLIRYLLRSQHGTPFEMCSLKLHVRVPMDAWRQWIRHRTAKVNEYSTRYSEAIDAAQRTTPDEWRKQATSNRQGSDIGEIVFPNDWRFGSDDSETAGEWLSRREQELQTLAREVYEERLKFGVAREQARKDLPLSTYTEAYWKTDLRNLLGFLGLRMDGHAQQEIRSYADVIGDEIVARWLPNVWDAFNCYHPLRNALLLSALDVQVINEFVSRSGSPDEPRAILLKDLPEDWAQVSKKTGKLKRNRERDEFETKASRLGYKCFFVRTDGTAADFSEVTRDTVAAHLCAEDLDRYVDGADK